MFQQENYNYVSGADEKIKELLLIAIKDELHDRNFYNQLAKNIDNKEDASIVRQISMDEQKHYDYLLWIYKKLVGHTPFIRDNKDEQFKIPSSLSKVFASSIFSELEAVEFYRRLMFMFLDLEVRDMIYEIITDEQAHATKFNYLYSKYKT